MHLYHWHITCYIYPSENRPNYALVHFLSGSQTPLIRVGYLVYDEHSFSIIMFDAAIYQMCSENPNVSTLSFHFYPLHLLLDS